LSYEPYDRMARPYVVPPVRGGVEPSGELIDEHFRRLTEIGHLPGASPADGFERQAAQWWPRDADDYSLDAPEWVPAGSCVAPSSPCYPGQRTVRRGA
jgi:hypothetical protein